jgi:nicotinamidase-related amidase
MTEFPSFYKPDRIGTLYHPDMSLIAAEAARAGLLPSAGDEKQARLLIVDMQVDFCHEQGSLFVPGAADDIRRLIEFIFRNAPYITDIICTMDSHLPFQIFHPPWWGDEAGRHPEPLTMITLQDLDEGRWRPLVRPGYSREYVRQLEVESKKVLTIWPYHVLLGGLGNALDPELWSAVMWHSLARKSQPTWLAKGRVPQTEHYSAIQPEIPAPGHPQGQAHRPCWRWLRRPTSCWWLAKRRAIVCWRRWRIWSRPLPTGRRCWAGSTSYRIACRPCSIRRWTFTPWPWSGLKSLPGRAYTSSTAPSRCPPWKR